MDQGEDGRSARPVVGGGLLGILLTALSFLVGAAPGFAACGDNVVEVGEACDDGNVTAGDCCSPACAFETANGPCPDDGNPCSEDLCDATGTCTHPAGGHAACDDGDPCTVDDVCGDGICAGTVVPERCIDAAVCYRARGAPRVSGTTLKLDDQLLLFSGKLRWARALCLPASTQGQPLIDPTTSLVAFRMSSSRRFRAGNWQVTDQFGTVDVELRGAESVLVAAGPGGQAPAPGSANHYACRTIRLAPGSTPPRGITMRIDDALGTQQHLLLRPKRLCRPADIDFPGSGIEHPRPHLMCYRLLNATTRSPREVQVVHQLQTTDMSAFEARELCVPAAATRPPIPCETAGDECGLPCCRATPGQHPDCTYDPVVADPRYRGCGGPTVLVDRTHVNFHQVTPESGRNPGRFWGLAKLLANDGYVVRDSAMRWGELLPTTTAKIIVLANPQVLAGTEAVSASDAAALVDWVEAGGSLLLSIDHPPFEKVEALLTALGLARSGRGARRFTFTRDNGGLNGASAIASGEDAASAIDEVTTFLGTGFSLSGTPRSNAVYDPVLVYPASAPRNLQGLLQGVAIELGAGRVYVSGESGGLTAQDGFGMHFTAENEQFLLNIIHWLDY